MRRLRSIAGLAALFCAAAGAQPRPKIELAGAYSYTRADLGPEMAKAGLSGWDGSATFNPVSFAGAIARFTGGYGRPAADGIAVKTRFQSVLFGPTVRRRIGRLTPFGYVLAGWCQVRGEPEGFPEAAGVGWSRAAAYGGGLDVRVAKRFSVRPFQGEYFETHSELLLTGRQGHTRFSAGVVFYPWIKE